MLINKLLQESSRLVITAWTALFPDFSYAANVLENLITMRRYIIHMLCQVKIAVYRDSNIFDKLRESNTLILKQNAFNENFIV